ncbi:hypothetical protein ACHAXS_003691 [Conticribra weissflogii]
MAGVDLTVYAETLISTVARAFYDDDAVCLIDILLRDKFLRDDDMAPRLSLPARQLRRTLQFLEEEHLVKHELVDDLAMGGSQNTKFWYIDYNHAVHVIRLRVHLLQKKLAEEELRARSSSLYLCPGYGRRVCNGRYGEQDAQQIVDPESGLFLCRECVRAYANHPNPPDKNEYTLKLLDNQKELKSAMDNLRRVKVQLSGKVDFLQKGQEQQQTLRLGVFDLLQKVNGGRSFNSHYPSFGSNAVSNSSGHGGGNSNVTSAYLPITSNLPSENIAMGIGSTRLAGTGRTAGNLLKKLVKKGIVSADGSDNVNGNNQNGGATRRGIRSGNGLEQEDELTFLKNAMGQEVGFELERGGGARANLLATKGRIRNKLVDAAAMKVGVDLGLVARVILEERERWRNARKKRLREENDDSDGDGDNNEEEADDEEDDGGDDNGGNGKKKKKKKKKSAPTNKQQATKKKKKKKPGQELDFLRDNLGMTSIALGNNTMTKEEREKRRLGYLGGIDDNDDDDDDSSIENDPLDQKDSIFVTDETDQLRNLPEDDRRAAFQAQYKLEVERQKKLLGVESLDDIERVVAGVVSEENDFDDNEDDYLENGTIAWEDG